MKTKRFGTQLKEFLAGIDKNEKLTPVELIERFKDVSKRGPVIDKGVVVANALRSPRFVKKVAANVRLAEGGPVVLYERKGVVKTMTLRRWTALQGTIKNAARGLRKYYDSRKKAVTN